MRNKKWMSVLMALILIFLLGGCGSSMTESTKEEAVGYELAADAAANGDYGGFAPYESAPKAEEMAVGEVAEGEEAEAEDETPETDPEKIIYSAGATLETTEFDSTVAAVEQMIKEAGGYIESSSVSSANYQMIENGSSGERNAFYTIRVPQDKLQEMLSELSKLGNVPNLNMYTENVTSRYYDTEARLESYRVQEERLLELLKEAGSVSDMLEIEGRLADVRYEIESLQTSLNYWDKSVSFSTLNLDIVEVSKYSPSAGENFGKRVKEAFLRGLDGLKGVFLGIVELLPILVILAVIAVVVILIVRKVRRKKAAAKPVESTGAETAGTKEEQ